MGNRYFRQPINFETRQRSRKDFERLIMPAKSRNVPSLVNMGPRSVAQHLCELMGRENRVVTTMPWCVRLLETIKPQVENISYQVSSRSPLLGLHRDTALPPMSSSWIERTLSPVHVGMRSSVTMEFRRMNSVRNRQSLSNKKCSHNAHFGVVTTTLWCAPCWISWF